MKSKLSPSLCIFIDLYVDINFKNLRANLEKIQQNIYLNLSFIKQFNVYEKKINGFVYIKILSL